MKLKHKITLFKFATFMLCALPMVNLVLLAANNQLGANPIETITHYTGEWSLRFLLLTLAITPIRLITRWSRIMVIRRMLGLYAFFYICMHFLTYFILDIGMDWVLIVEDIVERSYITLGFTALVLLIPLALTSSNGMMKRLGGKRWQKLHRLVYVSSMLGILHFLWLVKADLTKPIIYLGIFITLMLFRLPAMQERLRRSSPKTGTSSQKL